MAKVRMTPKRKNQVKKYRQMVERENLATYRALSRVIRQFGNDVEQDLTKLDILAKINFTEFTKRISTVLKTRGKSVIANSSKFVNNLFGFNISDQAIVPVKNKSIDAYHKEVDNLIQKVTDTTKKQISLVVAEGQADGLPLNQIAKRINEKFTEISKGRAKTIARTETSKAINSTTHNVAAESQLKYKIWMHTGAGATDRPEHLALDGTKIKIEEKFNVNGTLADYPHDPALPVGEIVNCNCGLIYE